MIWLALIFVAGAGLAVLLLGSKGTGGAVDPVAHYKAQLAEIDADEAGGMIDPESARAAKLEVQRRLLRAAHDDAGPAASSKGRLAPSSIAGLASLTLALAGVLYALMGAPTVPAAPPSSREAAENRLVQEGGPTFGEALESVRAHLADNGDDLQGWQVLANSARAVGDFATSAEAYGELARLDPDEPAHRVSQFEAYLAHGRGQVTPAARLVLAALLSTAPDHPAGQYYLGLAQFQAGNNDAARATWTALADRSAADAPWMPNLRRQLSRLGVQPPALSDEDVAAVDAMSEEEREAFLASMLARLEDRLDSNPADPAGWLMLARSKLALGDREGAIAALEAGIAANPGPEGAELNAFLDNLTATPNP